MGSLISPKVPTIDFTNDALKVGTSAWVLASKQVCEALEEFGCFVALYDKVPEHLDSAIFEAAKELFDLPSEVKSKNISEKPFHGYIGQLPIIPLHEGLGVDNVMNRDALQVFTHLMWPQGNDQFRETALSFAEKVAELDRMVVRMIFGNFGLDQEHYESHVAATSYLLRFLKYRAPETKTEGDNAIPRHTDKTFLSILHQNSVNGLEIKTREGEWVGFNLTPTSFVVIAGDASMGWSNDRIRSCDHRVTIKHDATQARYTVALFSFIDGVIQVPEELVDDDHPLKYNPFNNTALVHYYASEEGSKHEYTIKAYCGIGAA